uniref:Putative lipocalin n=1 Tax=Ixodes ricinus TaxID=34613 RepID=A0A6B0V8W5_IXORI
MGLQYALLFACVAAGEVWAQYERWTPNFHWTEKMTIKNPENNPTFNYPELGSLQDAWQVLGETSSNTYFLLFRTHVPVYDKCISTTANITDKMNKTANYTIIIYDTKKKKYENTTIQVRALNQTDYPLENVIRANIEGRLPSATPVPPGSYTYAEYDNSTCYSRSTPFPDRGNAVNPRLSARYYDDSKRNVVDELFPYPESDDYADLYVVYNEPQCYILRSPPALGGCDMWLRKTELKSIVEDLKDEIIKKEEELYEEHKETLGIYENCTATDAQKENLDFYVEDDIERWFQDVVWKRISLDCVLAFMITCGAPVFRLYNPITCNTSLTGQYVSIS